MYMIQARLTLILVCGLSTVKSADITLLVSKNGSNYDLKCVATGTETLAYGMTWIFENIDEFHDIKPGVSKYVGLAEIEKFDENTYLIEDFKNHIRNSLYKHLPPVFDHRWEGSHAMFEFNREVYVINLSILLLNDTSVVTIKLHTPTECLQVKVGRSTQKEQFSFHDSSDEPSPAISIEKWNHYTIYSADNIINLEKVTRDDNGYRKTLNKFNVSKMELTGLHGEKVIWKLHDYKFLEIPKLETVVRIFNSGIRVVTEENVCISFYLFSDQLCNVIVLVCSTDAGEYCIRKEFSPAGKWMEFKIDFPKKNLTSTFFHVFLQKSENCSAAIDDIRHCATNETRILSLNHKNRNVHCVSLWKQGVEVYYRVPTHPKKSIQNLENIGGANNISCDYLQQGKYCNKNVICNADGCYCSAGYSGNYCKTVCAGKWGINCEETCNCQETCNTHVGCICNNGTIGSTCNSPNITGEIKEVTATSVSFSMVGIENYNITKFECNLSASNEKDNLRVFNVSTSNPLIYGLIPNTAYNLSCKFCYLENCTGFKILTEFTTKDCLGISKDNIQYNSATTSINLTTTGLNFNHCPAILYDVLLNGIKIQNLQNVTHLLNLKQCTQYVIEVRLKEILNGTRQSIPLNVTTDYTVTGMVENIKLINGSCYCFKFDPPKNSFNITGYFYTFQVRGVGNVHNCFSSISNITIKDNSTEICKDLIPYRKYDLLVKAVNDKGAGCHASFPFTTESQDEIIDAETVFNISIINNETHIQFPDCNRTRGPLYFHVQSKCFEEWCKDGNMSELVINYAYHTTFKSFIQSLTPFAKHNFTITISRSEESTVGGRVINLDRTTPPKSPHHVSELAAYSLEDQKLFIRWKPPYPPTGQIELYQIYKCRNGQCNTTDRYTNCTLWDDYICSELDYCLLGLTYNISVFSKNKYVNLRSATSTCFQINKTGSESPKIFKAVSTTTCDIELEWSHPDITNGRIRHFNVTVIETKTKRASLVKIVPENIKRFYECKLTNLTSTNYNIYIQADNNNGEGQKSETLTVTTCSKYVEVRKSVAFEWFLSLCITTALVAIIYIIILLFIRFRKRMFHEPSSEELFLISSSSGPIKKTHLKALLSTIIDETGENIFEKEFQNVDDPTDMSQIAGSLPDNRLKNRFRNIIPYDDTRVILGDVAELDYINANYVHGHGENNFYIATQCPKRETVYDFWSMIWQENVMIIVCLATVSEGTNKMFQYWPDDYIHVQFEDFIIYHKSNYIETDFVVRHLEIGRDNERRDVLQLNYISWPDHSIPLFPISFLNYLKYAQALQGSNTGPTVVHCSAGIGRTGTYIMCDNLISIDDEVDILGYLKEIRMCRPSLVSRVSQYKLIYFILDEHYNGKNTAIQKRNILEMREAEADEILLKHYNYTFERQYAYDMLHFVSANDMISEMQSVFVDGYQGERKFVSIELQPKNFNNIWWTIEQNAVKTVLVLQETQGVNMFWPSDLPEKKVESFTINLEDVTNFDDTLVYDLKYTKSGNPETVRVYYYTNWKSNASKPNNYKSFYKLYTLYKKLNSEENQTVMLCCYNGSTACGLFITMDLVIKKLETDNVLDICWAVLGIRPHHPSFMEELEQYKFVYKMAKYHLESGERVEPEYQNTSYNVSVYENM